ncbi:MAG TPA: DUF1232 domain-containing protein [Polyangiaceae bacterium]|nr:DUF1232 domain-containing protein [Polyangiaceae bacterium]
MTPVESRSLEAFPAWLKSLAADARELAGVVENDAAADGARKAAAAALNYLFKSLDLIPDGLEDIGFIDDAFVFRVAAAHVASDATGDANAVIARLASDAALIEEFLGDVYPRLVAYVGELERAKVRGRATAEVIADGAVREDFVREVRAWADGYQAPSFLRDDKNLVKLRSFLSAKLK